MKPRISPTAMAVLAAAFGLVAAGWFLVVPLAAKLGALRLSEAELQAKAPVIPTKAQLQEEQRQKADAAELAAKAAALLPPSDRSYELAAEVEALARAGGVDLTSLSVTAAESTAPKTAAPEDGGKAAPAALVPAVKTVGLAVSVSGPYAQVRAFTGGLSKLARAVAVRQVVLNGSGPKDKDAGRVSATVTATAAYLPVK